MPGVPYDHRDEVASRFERAARMRLDAARLIEVAQRQARFLEAQAAHEIRTGLHIHRLCTSGSKARCCTPPEGIAS